MKKILVVLAALSFCSLGRADVTLTPVLSGLTSPVLATHAGDGSGRLFVVEQGGRINVLAPGASKATTFLDISDKVATGNEQGLLGLAFHPQFKSNRRFFVHYSRKSDGATIIAECAASATNPNRATAAERILLTVPQPYLNHNGGMMAFGPDGLLYIGLGDGGSSNDPGNRAQNKDELLGKILRIDVDHLTPGFRYAIPADNPFAGATAGRDEIYAMGLRNPWRFSFDRATGKLWCGDVGQSAWEEVDIVTRGGNYGWRTREGTHCTGRNPTCDALPDVPAFTDPIFEYAHDGDRCAVTGGYVYRGQQSAFPAGAYIFGDFCTGEVFQLLNGQFSVLGTTGDRITSFGEDESGELYICDRNGVVSKFESDGLRVSNVSLSEGNVPQGAPGAVSAVFTVTLNHPALHTVTVDYQTADNSAKSGADYSAVSGTLSFAPGQTSQTVAVPINGDRIAEANETFFLDLKAATNAPIIDNRGVASIRNDDGPSLRIADSAVDEGKSGTTAQSFTVTLSQASTDIVTVAWATADGSAGPDDYAADSGTLTFAPGETSKIITIQVNGDGNVEPNETYKVNLKAPSFAVIADSQAIGTILNDDAAALFPNDEPSS